MEYQEMLSAVKAFFGDTSRSPSETREGLEDLVADIEMLIDSLPEGDDE